MDIRQQQIDYYRARAREYDEWFYRQGRYDQGDALNRQWFDEAQTVRDALHSLPRVDHALELACGTGIWTQELVKRAERITALDASPEMIAINQAKVGASQVDYQQVDLFAWQPAQQVDLVFFGFWLSHVPPDVLDGFLATVARAVRPGGHLFMVDSRRDPTSTASNHVLPQDGDIHHTRKLNDGREFTIVKIFYDPGDLAGHLERAGFQANVHTTPHYFIYASATRKP